MSAFNVWVTERCNLCCAYCYEGKKRCIDMNDEVADKTVLFIQKNMMLDNFNMVNFHGGEPLLAIGAILRIIGSCNKFGKFSYSLTTNGTLINDYILEELKKHKVYVSLSIDGTKEVHDHNRKKHNGLGTYDSVVKSLIALQEREIDARVRMTITPETVSRLYESVMSIANLNAKTIVAMIDLYDDCWTDSLLNELQEKLVLIYSKLKGTGRVEFAFYSDLKKRKRGLCDGGIKNFNISADGTIYPCYCTVNDPEYIIGSVFSGIDEDLLCKHKVFYDERNTTCKGCQNEYSCLAMRCKYINNSLTGEYLTASPIMCRLEHILESIRGLTND